MPFVIDDLAMLAAIGAGGAGTAGAAGAGGLAAGAGAAGAGAAGAAGAGAAGAGAAGAAGAGAAGAGGLALQAPASMAPAMAPMANLTQPFAGTAQAAGGGIMGGGMPKSMDFSGVASRMAVPGAPGHAGGAPMPNPAGAQVGKGIMGGGPDYEGMMKNLGSRAGNAMSSQQPMQAPALIPKDFGPFQPFAFDRNNYRFRRPIGF